MTDALDIWLEKLEFLQQELAKASGQQSDLSLRSASKRQSSILGNSTAQRCDVSILNWQNCVANGHYLLFSKPHRSKGKRSRSGFSIVVANYGRVGICVRVTRSAIATS